MENKRVLEGFVNMIEAVKKYTKFPNPVGEITGVTPLAEKTDSTWKLELCTEPFVMTPRKDPEMAVQCKCGFKGKVYNCVREEYRTGEILSIRAGYYYHCPICNEILVDELIILS